MDFVKEHFGIDMGAGPWDVFNLGISKTLGILYGTASISVSFAILIIDVLLKEPIGIGTLICAFFCGPIMQFAFRSVKFDATKIRHQRLRESGRVVLRR